MFRALMDRVLFWRIEPFLTDDAPLSTARIAVVIPARNEAGTISRVIESWKAHRYNGPLRVFIVDDDSWDATATIARELIGESTRFELISAPVKPPDWTGKLWAVACGLVAARAFDPEYILFTDADVIHSPNTLNALIERATSGEFDMVSLMVRLHCATVAEKALIPAFVSFFFLLYPPESIADPRSSVAGAAGGCMLVRCAALYRAGGIESIRGALIDDCALAAAVKRAGGRVSLAPADSSASLRVYSTFGEIGSMISRTAFTQLRYSKWLLAATLGAMALVYLVPVLLAIFGRGAPRAVGLAVWISMSIAYMPTVRYHHISPLWSLTLPLAGIFYGGATLHSAVRYWQGRGGQWKGRAQAARS